MLGGVCLGSRVVIDAIGKEGVLVGEFYDLKSLVFLKKIAPRGFPRRSLIALSVVLDIMRL